MYYLNPKFLLNINDYKTHYFGWILLGDYYKNDILIKNNNFFNDKIIVDENIGARTSKDIGENLISFYSKNYKINYTEDDLEGNILIFNKIKTDEDNEIIYGDNEYIVSNAIVLVDYGEDNNSNEIIYYNEFVTPKNINTVNYKGFSVGKIKVNLNGLEE